MFQINKKLRLEGRTIWTKAMACVRHKARINSSVVPLALKSINLFAMPQSLPDQTLQHPFDNYNRCLHEKEISGAFYLPLV